MRKFFQIVSKVLKIASIILEAVNQVIETISSNNVCVSY